MTRPRILLLGAGGHGKAMADLLLADASYDVVGFVDAAPKASQVLGLPVLGDESMLVALAGQGIALAHAAVGDNAQRLAAAARLRAAGFALPSLTHPAALIGHGARVGQGAAVLAAIGDGNTPACAGKTSAPRERRCSTWEHPRVRGEAVVLAVCRESNEGTPPRVRGRLA